MSDDESGRDTPGEDDAPEPIEPTPSERDVPTERGRTLLVVEPISYVHIALGLLALAAVATLAGSAVDSLTKIVIGGVLALALDRPVGVLQRRGLPRGPSAAVVCVVALGLLSAFVLVLGPPAVREAAGFGDELPATIEDMYGFPVVGPWLEDAEAAGRSEEWLAELPGSITTESVSDAMTRAIAAVVSIVQVLLVTFALLFDGETLVRRARSLIPEHHRDRADHAGRLVQDTLGRYFAGSLLLAVMNGTYILTVGLILGVPLIVVAAVWVAITNLIPQIGGFLGGVVFVGLAVTEGAVTGVIALVLFVAYMSGENYLIQPAVVGKAVNLSPPTTMMAAILGGAAAGVPGALVTTPLVGSVKALYMATRYGDPAGPDGDSDSDPDPEASAEPSRRSR
ncbi:MAG: AI-2E family transporter [Acidimicrobiales bacterium]